MSSLRLHTIVASTLLAGVCLAGSAQDAVPPSIPPLPTTPGAKPSVTPPQEAKPPAAAPVPQEAKPPATPETKQPQTRLRSGVDLVSLNVTVMEGGRYISDLDEADFEIYEDGAKQAITFFSRVQQPIALAILLDTSASMNERLGTAQEAAIGFARRMRREDVIEVIDFDSQARILQTFTNDVAALEKAIRSTDVNGSTSLYNAIYVSLKELKRAKASSAEEIRRQAIVVLSDGDDTSSLVPYEEVLDLAKRSETAIYAIGLRPTGSYRSEFKEAEFVLKQLSQETGGRAYFVLTAAELPKIYEQISEELANQYSLAYSSKNPMRNGAWRRVVVRVNKPGLTARTRLGYYGPGQGR
jgi:Ca-activated chloride channel family protein